MRLPPWELQMHWRARTVQVLTLTLRLAGRPRMVCTFASWLPLLFARSGIVRVLRCEVCLTYRRVYLYPKGFRWHRDVNLCPLMNKQPLVDYIMKTAAYPCLTVNLLVQDCQQYGRCPGNMETDEVCHTVAYSASLIFVWLIRPGHNSQDLLVLWYYRFNPDRDSNIIIYQYKSSGNLCRGKVLRCGIGNSRC